MKLQTKILLAVFPLIVIPLLISGAIAYQRLQQTATDTLNAQIQTLLQQTAQQAQSFEKTTQANARLFSASQMLQGYLLADEEERYDLLYSPLLQLFLSYQQAYPAYIEIRVILPDGYEDVRVASKELDNLTEDESDNTQFQYWIKTQQETYSHYLHHSDNQEFVLQVAQRLQFIDPAIQERNANNTGILRGFLVITARLEHLKQQAVKNAVGKKGQLLFADQTGRLLFQSQKASDPLPSELIQRMQQQHTVQWHSPSGIFYQGQSLQANLWVFTTLPETEISAYSQRLGIEVASIIFITVLITLWLLMLLLNRQLLKPIKALGKATLNVGQGHLDAQLVVHSQDEMGILIQRFNTMAQQLKTTQQQKDQAQEDALNNKEQAIENLKQADQLKNEFLANTSHELRTPLNGIIGISESLLDGIGGEPTTVQAQNLRMIVQSGKRLSTLVNDILDSFKMQTKELQLQRRPVDIYAMSSLALELSHTLVAQKDLELRNDVPQNLPPVYADENRLQQILLNLIGNAIKFTQTGHVTVSATINAQKLMQIAVQDTGIGIPADKQAIIFQAFKQADGSTAREYGGTGLGLSVTQQLVELHEGKVWVNSQKEQGSCFYFTLPLSEDALPDTVEYPAIVSDNAPLDTTEDSVEAFINSDTALSCDPGMQGHCRVLIVDDEPVNLHVLVNYLSRHHYQLTLASSGQETLNLLDEGYEPDIIILDVMMPRMTGFEVTHIIRKTKGLHELPILLLTAKNQAQDIVTGLEAGANDYLIKPVAKEELLARIRTHLSIKHLKASREAALETARLKSEFLANMSHEIRTPMNAIIGVSDLLYNTSLSDEQKDYVSTIRTGSDTLLTLINDILDFSKIEAGKLELEQQAFSIRSCVEDALDLVSGIAHKKDLNLAYWIDFNVPIQIKGDITRVRQILVNLLSNAIKFTQVGEVMVKVSAQPITQTTEQDAEFKMTFAVCDTGVGIPKELQEKLFQAFTQVDSSITRRYGGTGLGLTICKRLTELMKGRIWVDSVEDQGSTFYFTMCLPAVLPAKNVQKWQATPRAFSGKRWLMLEEYSTNREIVCQLSKFWAADIQVTDYQDFIHQIKIPLTFDAVLIEWPSDVLKSNALQEALEPLSQKLPLLLITSGCHASSITSLFKAFITRPIRPERLYESLAQIYHHESKKVDTQKSIEKNSLNMQWRILLTEDNLVNQKVALLVLKQLGLKADIANNGLEALTAVQENTYDVVFMDMQMPEMDGLTATRAIREQDLERQPWIIAMTANAMEEDQKACFDAGMNDYVSKPVRPQKLSDALQRFGANKETAS